MQLQKTVLFANGNQDFLLALTRLCQDFGVKVETAADGLEALVLSTGVAPDLIILDIDQPSTDGLDKCEILGKNVSTSSIPIIILTVKSDEETLHRCKLLGVHYVHKNAEIWDNLKSRIGAHMSVERAFADQPDLKHEGSPEVSAEPYIPKILLIDDDPQITKALMIRLSALGVEVIKAPNATSGTYLAWTESPDLIITDQNMPDMTGESLIVKLRNDEETKNIPVIMITGQRVDGHEDFRLKREMLGRCGAVAYLTKPLDFDELVEVLGQYVRLPVPPSRSPVSAAG